MHSPAIETGILTLIALLSATRLGPKRLAVHPAQRVECFGWYCTSGALACRRADGANYDVVGALDERRPAPSGGWSWWALGEG